MAKINPYAKSLSDSLFRPRIVKAKKGKASYSRKSKHRKSACDA